MSTLEKRIKKMSQFGVLLFPLVGSLWLADSEDRFYYIGWVVLGFIFGWMLALGIIDHWIRKENSRNVLEKAQKEVVDFMAENKAKVKHSINEQ